MTNFLPASARVVEIGDVTVGIVIPETNGAVRFFSAGREFDSLDRRSFRSVVVAMKAVRDLLAGRTRVPHAAETPRERSSNATPVGSRARAGSCSQAKQAGAAAPTSAQILGFNPY